MIATTRVTVVLELVAAMTDGQNRKMQNILRGQKNCFPVSSGLSV